MKKVLSAILVLIIMCTMAACGGEKSNANIIPSAQLSAAPSTEAKTPATTAPEKDSTLDNAATEEEKDTASDNTATEEDKDSSSGNTIDPDFKAAMDSYEEFFDEYVKIMKKYKENPEVQRESYGYEHSC